MKGKLRIPEDIRKLFLNRTAAVLSALFVLFSGAALLFPARPTGPDAAGSGSLGPYIAEVSNAWDRLATRYLGFGMPVSDILFYAAFSLLGFCAAYFGTEYFVRRRTDGVIKRFFTHPEDKR